MLLLAQVDFAEVRDRIGGLPEKGVMQSFLASGDLPVMGEANLTNGAARLRILNDADLQWFEGIGNAPGTGIRFERVLTSPAGYIDGLTDEENDSLAEHLRADGHRMLGHPSVVQYDPLEYTSFNPHGTRMMSLQIDSDPTLGWHWVDQGVLQFLSDFEAFRQGRIEDGLFDMQFL